MLMTLPAVRRSLRSIRLVALGALLACAQATSFSTTVEAQTQIEGGTLLEQLAGDIFNDRLKDTTKQQPVQQLAACSREQVMTHFRNHHVELYWQNCISRELSTPFWHTLRKHVNDESLGTQP